MDTSKEYIKMCDCPEIQGIKPDCYLEDRVQGTTDVHHGYWSNYWSRKECEEEWYVWLPRQDQLQEILFTIEFDGSRPCFKDLSGRGLLLEFWTFVDENWVDYLWEISDSRESQEMLWLAFVMKEKFNKTWNGEKWKTNK